MNFSHGQHQSDLDNNVSHPVEGGVNSETPSPDQDEADAGGVRPRSDDTSSRMMKRETDEKKKTPHRMCVVENPDFMSLGSFNSPN